jgi:hypothetical protein
MGHNTKTIAILTFHCAKSYGAVLQTYALYTYLRSQCYKVRIINLRPPAITGVHVFRPGSWVSAIVFGIFERKYFKVFSGIYRKVHELKKKPPIADYYIVGSDQVWNPEITKEYQLNYFFDFAPEGKKLISYAASFGKDSFEVDDEKKNKIRELLNKFHATSIRESSGAKICKKLFEVDVEVTVDPTFIISDYSEITGTVKEEKHIVCFKLKKDSGFYEVVRMIGDKLDMPVKILDSSRSVQGVKAIPKPSVTRWLKTLKSAAFVVTDSFHGVAFSIIFKKNFIVVPANILRFTRIKDMLSRLSLEERIFYSYDEIVDDERWQKNIDFTKVFFKLEKLRSRSVDFLNQALS